MDLLAEKADEIEQKMSTRERQKLSINPKFQEVSKQTKHVLKHCTYMFIFW